MCKPCPEGTDRHRSARFRACFCRDGFARTNRFSNCSHCSNEGLNCTRDYQYLRRGYYWNWSFPASDLQSYSKFVANLLTMNNSYEMSSRNYSLAIPMVFKCPKLELCENSNSSEPLNIQGTCAKGHRGWLCTKCKDDFYNVMKYCLPCPKVWWSVSELVVLTSLCVFFAVIMMWKKSKATKRNVDRLFIDHIASRMKIFLGFYQIVGELYESINIINLDGPLRYIGYVLQIVTFNLLRILVRPQCINKSLLLDPILRFEIAMFFPVALTLLLVLIYLGCKVYFLYWRRCRDDDLLKKLGNTKSKLAWSFILILFVTFQPTCDAIFEIYPGACDDFVVHQERNDTISLLRADYDIRCDYIKTFQTEAYIATALYVLLFPLVLYLLLRRYCKNARMDGRNDIRVHSAMHEGLSDDNIPLISQTEDCKVPMWLNFLCENYKGNFWYWEIVELARKVIQTMLITLLGWEDALTKLFTIGTSVLFLTLHVKYAPMKSHFEQRLQVNYVKSMLLYN